MWNGEGSGEGRLSLKAVLLPRLVITPPVSPPASLYITSGTSPPPQPLPLTSTEENETSGSAVISPNRASFIHPVGLLLCITFAILKLDFGWIYLYLWTSGLEIFVDSALEKKKFPSCQPPYAESLLQRGVEDHYVDHIAAISHTFDL